MPPPHKPPNSWGMTLLETTLPTRKITASAVKVTGTVPNDQKFESKLEEDFLVLLRFDPDVLEFTTQSETVPWVANDGSRHTYTPDVLIKYRPETNRKTALVEVKPDLGPDASYQWKPPRSEDPHLNQLKWEAATRYAQKRGWDFYVQYEKDIRTPYLQNARFLLRHLERGEPSKYDTRLLEKLQQQGAMPLKAWCESISASRSEQAHIYPACYRLIGLRSVRADIQNSLLTSGTLISPKEI